MKLERIIESVLLVLCAALLVTIFTLRFRGEKTPEPPAPAETPVWETPVPAAPTPSPTPVPTPSPTPEPTPEPVRRYTFSFAGDCTIGSLLEWQGNTAGDFQSVVGTDYAAPLSGVQKYFAKDDFTMVNMESTLTTSSEAVYKKFRFRADPAYAKVFSQGSVEMASLANNHAGDFGQQGRADSKAALTAEGVLYTDAGEPLIHELDGGLLLGVVSYNTVENAAGEAAWRESIENDIAACREAGCDIIIGFMHWGSVEYLPEAEPWAVQLGHDMVDWGCDMVVGGHAHILQPMEYYNNVPIFYSMGNFCYGGHLNPQDKDSVIVQADFLFDAAADSVSLEDVRVIPCSVSSVSDRNDYRPTPYEEGSDAYQRVLGKLAWNP